MWEDVLQACEWTDPPLVIHVPFTRSLPSLVEQLGLERCGISKGVAVVPGFQASLDTLLAVPHGSLYNDSALEELFNSSWTCLVVQNTSPRIQKTQALNLSGVVNTWRGMSGLHCRRLISGAVEHLL